MQIDQQSNTARRHSSSSSAQGGRAEGGKPADVESLVERTDQGLSVQEHNYEVGAETANTELSSSQSEQGMFSFKPDIQYLLYEGRVLKDDEASQIHNSYKQALTKSGIDPTSSESTENASAA